MSLAPSPVETRLRTSNKVNGPGSYSKTNLFGSRPTCVLFVFSCSFSLRHRLRHLLPGQQEVWMVQSHCLSQKEKGPLQFWSTFIPAEQDKRWFKQKRNPVLQLWLHVIVSFLFDKRKNHKVESVDDVTSSNTFFPTVDVSGVENHKIFNLT